MKNKFGFYRNMRLFPKTFITMLLIMLFTIAAAFTLVYTLLPIFYENYKKNEFETNANTAVKYAETLKSEEVKSYFDENSLSFDIIMLFSEDFYIYYISPSLGYTLSYFENFDDGYSSSTQKNYDEYNSITEMFVFTDADGNNYSLTLGVSLSPIEEALDIMAELIPYAVGACILLSLVFSLLFSRSITKPVKTISDAALKMRSMDKEALCEIKTKNELGNLADNINTMYSSLLLTIDSLEKDIDRLSEDERSKVQFFQSASHELKTPVTAAIGMVEGMIYNVGKYKDHGAYLKKTLETLNRLTELIRQIIDTSGLNFYSLNSEIQEFFLDKEIKTVSEPYEIIAKSKNIDFKINIEQNIKFVCCKELFVKAISNILSNAVKYTYPNGKIDIYYKNDTLSVDNECSPLSDEITENIFTPFYRPYDKNNNGGNGLGMYIISTSLDICGLKYEFKPFESGMRFTIEFK